MSSGSEHPALRPREMNMQKFKETMGSHVGKMIVVGLAAIGITAGLGYMRMRMADSAD